MIYLANLILLGLVSAVGLCWWELNRVVAAVERHLNENPSPDDRRRITELEGLVDMLPVKWDEMVAQANRQERRARSVVRSAQAKLESAGLEDPALEAEGDQLQRLDDDRGEEPELRIMPTDVDHVQALAEAGDRSWQEVTMAKKYGG